MLSSEAHVDTYSGEAIEGKGEKHVQSEVSDGKSEDDGLYHTSKKGKGCCVLNSSDLDG
jgi:hypothetical protein